MLTIGTKISRDYENNKTEIFVVYKNDANHVWAENEALPGNRVCVHKRRLSATNVPQFAKDGTRTSMEREPEWTVIREITGIPHERNSPIGW